ncbi:MAG: ABC transporter ATP-binding protein, partial [Clostridia bacterium]
MHKMLKHLKKYFWVLAGIVVLLVAQAMCDLQLPTYTAAIVDVGIQQEGIAHSTPSVVRASTLEALKLWMPADEIANVVEPSYAPAEAGEAEKL